MKVLVREGVTLNSEYETLFFQLRKKKAYDSVIERWKTKVVDALRNFVVYAQLKVNVPDLHDLERHVWFDRLKLKFDTMSLIAGRCDARTPSEMADFVMDKIRPEKDGRTNSFHFSDTF